MRREQDETDHTRVEDIDVRGCTRGEDRGRECPSADYRASEAVTKNSTSGTSFQNISQMNSLPTSRQARGDVAY
jgi:hypothetical protein